MRPKRIFFKSFLIFLFFSTLSSLSFGQTKFTLSGYIRDAGSGEDLIGASAAVPEAGVGAYSNEYGFYSLTLPAGEYEVNYRYIGFKTQTIKINLNSDQSQSVELVGEGGVKMDDVVITGEKDDENVKSVEMSVVKVNIKEIKKMPALFGEVDVIKVLQLMPGVSTVGEGLSGYYVRGGNADHNLILLDEASVFNASHVLGFFSVFNADALKDDFKLYKGGIPAKYGGRLASVLDLRMKEGNSKSFHGKGGIGLLSSRLSFEGPIQKDKGSFIVSGRRTYADLFLKFSKDDNIKDSQAYFYDLNAKLNYKFSDKDRIFLSGYFGRDVFGLRNLFGQEWGNGTGTIRWNHLFSDKLFSNTTLIYSDFNYGFDFNLETLGEFKFDAGIRDFSLKNDFNYFLSPEMTLKFGFQTTLHRFEPGKFTPTPGSSILDSLGGDSLVLNEIAVDPEYAVETGIYLSNEHKVNERVSLDYGVRFSMFQNIGPGTEYKYDWNKENILDSTVYKNGQLIKNQFGFEPRFGMRYSLDGFSSMKLSYNRMRQYLHLASNSTASFPWDVWVPSSYHIPPQIADQIALGYFRNFFENKVEASVEVYYKHMQNQIDFKDGAELILNPTIETELLYGKGWSYGAEFFLKKKIGRFTGWIGYTWSKTQRRIRGINNNEVYNAKNDRRHDFSVVMNYTVNDVLDFSGTWVYYTGNAVTFPAGKYNYLGYSVGYYPARNSNRMPDFHRLDLAANINLGIKKERRFANSLNISLYNAYGRKNAFAIQFEEDEDDASRLTAVKTYLFRWVPSVTWNFSF